MEADCKYQCKICYDLLRDARLTECCGQHYCGPCLDKWIASSRSRRSRVTCPQCREENFTHIVDKSLTREIDSRGCSFGSTGTYDGRHKFRCIKCKLEPVREPCLTACCGQHWCRSCLTDWLREQQQHRRAQCCPHCGQENFTHILNKSLKREIDEVFVRCDHLKQGCQWIGRPESLTGHLQSPDGCEYTEVECRFELCYKTFRRMELECHQQHCKYRRENCEHCGLEVSHNAMYLHHDECLEIPTLCPNNCGSGELIKRKDLHVHFRNCPTQVVDCPYKNAGCAYRVARKDMVKHTETNTVHHMALLQEHNRKLEARVSELAASNGELRRWNRELVIERMLCT